MESGSDYSEETRRLSLLNSARTLYHPPRFESLVERVRQRSPGKLLYDEWNAEKTAEGTSIMICHSFDDDVVSSWHGEQASRLLQRMGLSVLHYENIAGSATPKHWVAVPRGPNDIATFITDTMNSCPHYYNLKVATMDGDGKPLPRPVGPAMIKVGSLDEHSEPVRDVPLGEVGEEIKEESDDDVDKGA